MEKYFQHVIESLTMEDVYLLGILQDYDAVSKQKSIKNSKVLELSNNSEAKYRKTIDRLSALQFVVLVKDYKEHTIYISEYGTLALSEVIKSMEG